MDKRDKELWKQVAQSISPLKKQANLYSEFKEQLKAADPKKSVEPDPVKPKNRIPFPKAQLPDPSPVLNKRKLNYLEHGVTHNVDRRTSERLVKGKMEIDGRIDLHGYSQEEAHRALNAFIGASASMGRRCVLIVTGKGSGILKRAVPMWLNDPLLRPLVLSFSYAQQRDGGSGALYVLLKRRRG